MSRRAIGWLGALGVGVVLAGMAVLAQSTGGADSHVATAKAAVGGPESNVLFTRLCVPAAPAPAAAAPAAPQAAAPQGPPPRARWYAEPAKVFDNLYFLGQTEYTAWAVLTSDGIIVIDPLFEYSVEEEVANGLVKLGADPKRIRYVLVSHAHRDHVGGARFLQERFGARVIMSAADWDLLDRTGGSWPKPKRDIVAADGQRLTLGDTTLTIHHTPGHTLGTVSTIIPVKDGGRMHTAALWGGTGFNWLGNGAAYKDQPHRFWFQHYSTSARRFRDVVAKAGADVLLSNHPNYDGSKTHLPAIAARKTGERHPYVIGNDRVRRFLTVAEECAQAGLGRLS